LAPRREVAAAISLALGRLTSPSRAKKVSKQRTALLVIGLVEVMNYARHERASG
jgi:hypothetical protein